MEASKTPKLRRKAAVCYWVVAALFVAFALYMLCFEHAGVFQAREDRGYEAVTDYTLEIQPDPQAPAGINRVFRWNLNVDHASGDSIAFYLVHHSAKVYLDGELVYSLQLGPDNRIGKSVGSNWVIVPIYPEDAGAEVTVIATPAYTSVAEREIDFLVGSRYSVFYDCLLADADNMIIALICVLIGLFIMSMQGYMWLNRNPTSREMFYLGDFAATLGFWRLTDNRIVAFLLPNSTMALGYIIIAALVLCMIPMLLFMKERLADFDGAPLLHASILLSAGALLVLALQVFGIADFREILPVWHVVLVGSAVMLVVVVVVRNVHNRSLVTRRSVMLVALLAAGTGLDILSYYIQGKSENVVFTAMAFVIYVVCLFTCNIYETKTKAYTDPNTGLFNKNRWDELMNQKIPVSGDVGLMMLDLNGLKRANDTFGHEAGDRMIFNFANILRNTLPPESVICRWGGDEFTVLQMDASAQKMEQYIAELHRAAQLHNEAGNPPFLHFAAGYALASEFPELTWEELLSRADERMYQDKRSWYQNMGVK